MVRKWEIQSRYIYLGEQEKCLREKHWAKEINPGISLEGMMLKLKLQYFGHPMRRVDSLKKTLMLGGIGAREEGDDRGWDGWMASPMWWTWIWLNSGSWWWTGRPGLLQSMGLQRIRHDWATELIWTGVKRTDKKSHCTRRPNGSSHNLVQKLTLSIPMANRKKTGTRIYHNALSFLRETVYQMVWNGKHFLTLKGWEHIIFKMY